MCWATMRQLGADSIDGTLESADHGRIDVCSSRRSSTFKSKQAATCTMHVRFKVLGFVWLACSHCRKRSCHLQRKQDKLQTKIDSQDSRNGERQQAVKGKLSIKVIDRLPSMFSLSYLYCRRNETRRRPARCMSSEHVKHGNDNGNHGKHNTTPEKNIDMM